MRRLTSPAPDVLAHVQAPDAFTAKIMRGTLEQFEIVGIRRSTMDDIAERAGVSRATLYRRFPTKADLVEAVVLGEVLRYFEESNRAHEAGDSFEEKFVNGTIFNFEFVRNNALLQRLLVTDPVVIVPALTIEGDSLVELATALGAEQLARMIYGDAQPTAAQRQHMRAAAELHTRITLSFALTPKSSIDLDNPEAIRRYVENHIMPTAVPPAWCGEV